MAASMPRWYHLTPDRLVIGLLAAESLLWLSARFQLFSFTQHKGWAALVAVACAVAFLLLMLLWFVVALLFRMRFQYSIRSLLVLTAAIAVPCGWFSAEFRKARDQRSAVRALESAKFGVWYDFQTEPSGKHPPHPPPPGPAWLRRAIGDDLFEKLLGKDFFADVVAVRSFNYAAADADVQQVAGFARLRTLTLARTQITDAAMTCLDGLGELRELDLRLDDITDAGLAHVARLTRLECLHLGSTQVTDAGLGYLEGLTGLQELSVSGKTTDAGLKHLKVLTQLRILHLGGTRITDTGLAELEGLTKLQELDVRVLGITNAGLRHLGAMADLRLLRIYRGPTMDVALPWLKKTLPACRVRLN